MNGVMMLAAVAAVGSAFGTVVEWEFPRTGCCHEGMPFADGRTGVLVWGGGDTVNLTVGRGDLWDHRGGYPWTESQNYSNIVDAVAHRDNQRLRSLFSNTPPPNWNGTRHDKSGRFNPYMLPLGRVIVTVPGRSLRKGRLDTATGLGEIEFADGTAMRLAFSRDEHLFAMRLPDGVAWSARTVPATECGIWDILKCRGFEKALVIDGNPADCGGLHWKLPVDRPVWIGWRKTADTLLLKSGRDAWAAPATMPFAEIARKTSDQWWEFWREGARIRVPDPAVQTAFDFGMYKFGSMTDPDGFAAGLQGQWLEDDYLVPWNGDYHFNINIQECYSPAFRGGHFRNLMPLFRMVLGWRSRLRDNARKFVGIGNGYTLPHSVDDRGVCIGGFWAGTIDHASTAWIASLMMRYVRYSRDLDFLRDDAYDFMKGAMNVYRAMMEEHEGRLTIPVCPSPEWGESDVNRCVGRDPSFQLAAAHRLARDLLDAAKMLGEKPDPMWLEVERRLPAFTRGKGGVQLFEGQPLTESHRHHSHLAGFYPFDTIDVEANRDVVRETFETWDRAGHGKWTGWCLPWAAILNVHRGNADGAAQLIRDWKHYFNNPGHGSLHDAWVNGYTCFQGRKTVMQIDGQCAAVTAVMEMMAHEVNGKVEFFRGCPDSWKDVSFENLALSDGRRVSARRVNGKVEFTRASDPIRSPAFFWMWNDRLEESKLFAQLEDMCAHGIRNVCIHPFPKDFRPESCPSRMEPDYLSEGFLVVYTNVVGKAASLGMHAYLYDEGGWPSGSACGQVARSDPEGRFRRRAIDAGGNVKAIDYQSGCPYPSVIEKGATERFLDLTHEKYARRLGGELGTTVKIAFTDEPCRYTGKPGELLGWTTDFAEVFKRKKGYDIVPFAGDLIGRDDETDDALARLRIDYQEVAADLFAERYLLPLRTWCRRRGVLSGGHLNGEDNPCRARQYGFGNLLRSLRLLDAPGVDVIWRQLAAPPVQSYRELSLPFPRYASSASHQIGSEYALSETFAIYGDSLDPFEVKWNIDFQLVRGINTFVFAYYNYSDWGPWMAMFEPHFGPSAPCWDFLPHLFGYVTRACETLSRGRPGAECAVLYDMRGLWAGGADTEAAARAQEAVAKALDDLQVDYDFFDEDILADSSVGKGVIRMGKMEYRTLVLPTSKWLRPESKAVLDRFRAAGGTVADFNTVSKVPRTLQLRGGNAAMRVMKRVDGARSIYFLVNSSRDDVDTEIEFPEGGRVLRYEPDANRSFTVAADGRVRMRFAGGESAVFFTGDTADAPRIAEIGDTKRILDSGWTVRKVAEHVAGRDTFERRKVADEAKPVRLGDWRGLFGDTFSGKAIYRIEFTVKEAGQAELDLGDVRYCAGVKLNGENLGRRFFGPYKWRCHLAGGVNVLEVEVCNLLVNQTGNEEIRSRINRDHPPRSTYDRWQRPFDRINHDSGLYGPVSITM